MAKLTALFALEKEIVCFNCILPSLVLRVTVQLLPLQLAVPAANPDGGTRVERPRGSVTKDVPLTGTHANVVEPDRPLEF